MNNEIEEMIYYKKATEIFNKLRMKYGVTEDEDLKELD